MFKNTTSGQLAWRVYGQWTHLLYRLTHQQLLQNFCQCENLTSQLLHAEHKINETLKSIRCDTHILAMFLKEMLRILKNVCNLVVATGYALKCHSKLSTVAIVPQAVITS
jgi:hypothetical protein